MTFRLKIAYDGTDFLGWQAQPHGVSVYSCLIASFKEAFGQEAYLMGPSRTDAGVHALGYVAVFRTDLLIDAEKIRLVWNFRLPQTIHIRFIEKISDEYNPRHNLVQKTYYYHLFTTRPLPFLSRFGWYYTFINQIDMEQFVAVLQLFEGEHNFRAFCKVEPGEKINTVRVIDSVKVELLRRWNVVRVVVKAHSFLRHQIRRIVGTALDVVRRSDMTLEYIHDGLASGKAGFPTVCAPAKGLCLRKIVYKI